MTLPALRDGLPRLFAAIAVLLGATSAGATEPLYELRLTVECLDTTESGADEVYIEYSIDDGPFARYPATGTQEMNEPFGVFDQSHEDRNWSPLFAAVFTRTVVVRLMEDDPEDDDRIGTATFTKSTGGSQTLDGSGEYKVRPHIEWRTDLTSVAVPTDRDVYVRSVGGSLYLHARGGSTPGAEEALHACSKAADHPNCKWRFEPSPTRPGAWYVKVSDQPLYLHAEGGSNEGARNTLHDCPKSADHPNCQWYVRPNNKGDGGFFLRSADARLYVHALGGSTPGAPETLHPCPFRTEPNCQWMIEDAEHVVYPAEGTCRATAAAFAWSCAGPVDGWHCTQIHEAADPHAWNDNYFCSRSDIGMKWSSAGPIAGMQCTQITESADPHTWSDNYLCLPSGNAWGLQWRAAGPIEGKACIQWSEPSDPHTWADNFLCWDPAATPP